MKVVCSNCRKEFNRPKSKIGKSGEVYCAFECYRHKEGSWLTSTLADFKVKYGVRKYHGKLRELSRRQYLKSDKPKECKNCGYNKHFDVCHIKDIKDFDLETPIREVHCIDNLIALCKNCHWEFDNGYLDISCI